MKVLFDTNVYIGWLRAGRYADVVTDHFTTKYLSSIVLMELWAGAKDKRSARVLDALQAHYFRCARIATPSAADYISAGRFFSALPAGDRARSREAGFVNDVLIALSSLAAGATVFTANRDDFAQISSRMNGLRVVFLQSPAR